MESLRSGWKNLVFRQAGNSMSMEEEHSIKYKTPIPLVNFSNRASIFILTYVVIACCFYIGDIAEIFWELDKEPEFMPDHNKNHSFNYQMVYILDRPVKY